MFKSFKVFFVVLLFAAPFGIAHAQSSLTHDTGPVQMTVYDDGAIGQFVFNGNANAMFTAGIIGGNLSLLGGAFGMIGSFIDANGPIIWDMYNVTPLSGFSSDPFFNQISSADVATNLVPGADTHLEYKSNTGQNFVFLHEVITNNSTFDWQNLFFGIFADWDVGNYALNQGGYDTQRNMLYQFENGGAMDSSYYGILLVDAPPDTVKGTVDKDIAIINEQQLRQDIFNLMTSTAFAPIASDGDYRTYLSTGPYAVPLGDSVILDYAFVAGTSLIDLQSNADDAILYWQNATVGIVQDGNGIPKDFTLDQNYPNPFNPTTTIEFSIPKSEFVTLKIYNTLGQEVATPVSERLTAGQYKYEWDASSLASGVYLYRIQAGGYVEAKKMILLR